VSVVIGIDPGAESGAIACFVDGELLDVVDMPCADGIIAASLLRAELWEFACADLDDTPTIIVEKVHAMPKQGVTSSFKFGRSLGVIEGVIAGMGWPIVWVTPQEWKRHRGLLRQDKDAARMLALERWPSHAGTFRRKRDVGRADAALIAAWGIAG
jgi:crossover junction endodeoxyribonuclease RuvC